MADTTKNEWARRLINEIRNNAGYSTDILSLIKEDGCNHPDRYIGAVQAIYNFICEICEKCDIFDEKFFAKDGAETKQKDEPFKNLKIGVPQELIDDGTVIPLSKMIDTISGK